MGDNCPLFKFVVFRRDWTSDADLSRKAGARTAGGSKWIDQSLQFNRSISVGLPVVF
jgi:hypothetical protein